MKRLCFLFISLFVIGCSDFNPIESEGDCGGCGFEITSPLPKTDGVYELEYNDNLAQTYSTLSCATGCGWGEHIQWESDYKYRTSPNDGWTSLVNPASMTDEFGEGKIVFAVWEAFIGKTITIYGGYFDDCGNQHIDSVKVLVVNNE